MTIEQLHTEWREWVRDKMAVTAKSDLSWLAWQAAYQKAATQCAECPVKGKKGKRVL